ncbi:hypothetical protein N657DRAFT_184997 [Parathielavia appendiculata]|uniref:Altered inheritance of mitochondria protein 21 n=1 Tax=Parathielavia appendiculata TaxID=2587402 RepID=A0AAN6U8I8_9PEZI|nr:hypothetical protein N657DRAFT_184997 [Parathielavia appendiculata]
MSAATANPPAIPPRPSRSQEKQSTPMIPPRPTNRRVQRSISPNPDRFAPSPLNEGVFKFGQGLQPGARNGHNGDLIARPTSVELPTLGEEGKEYESVAEELSSGKEGSASPEQTRTVAHDLKLHAPKPSLPASSAKQRVMAVTRTDSERAASFGIGRPSSVDESGPAQPSSRSLKKKASTTSQLSTPESHDEEHGIPEIGLQVPMLKNAGDVQAPSPAPAATEGLKGRHHSRRTSAHGNLPPGSYGLHGHGVAPQDKLEKAYYEKHPDLLKKEHVPHHYDRPNDFSMSRDDLNKIVRETASRGAGLATKNYAGTPSEQIGWQALEESASRIASPSIASPELEKAVIHIDEPNRRRSVMFSDTESNAGDAVKSPYTAPILAEDEIAKDPSGLAHQPAVEPPAFELEGPSSRPTSRPASLYKETSFEKRSTPLEDVKEYEPLFKDDENIEEKKPAKEEKRKSSHSHRFPSADVWEDAPSSVFYTTEVSTPEVFDESEKPSPSVVPPPREGETPAQAFARHQEELAERELRGERVTGKPLWAQHQKHLIAEKAASRPNMQQRFPSRDVWEDTPESLQLETTVSTPQQDDAASPSPADALNPEIPDRPQPKPTEPPAPTDKPAVPERPKPRQASVDDKPAVPDRPKPQIPARPAKAGPTSGGLEPAEAAAPPPRQKPAVPARPMGSKIAALAGGFMNDLNRRLQLGPQAPPQKKEEPEDEEQAATAAAGGKEKEKVPLSDARKGRARGPQRRAPAAAASAAAAPPVEEKSCVVCGVVGAVTFFEIDPDEGIVSAGGVTGVPEPGPEAEIEAREKKLEDAEVEATPAEALEDEEEEADVAAEPEPKHQDASTTYETKAQPVAESQPELKAEAEHAPKAEPGSEPEKQETKSLATNMAGETLIAEDVKKDEEHEAVESVKVVEH